MACWTPTLHEIKIQDLLSHFGVELGGACGSLPSLIHSGKNLLHAWCPCSSREGIELVAQAAGSYWGTMQRHFEQKSSHCPLSEGKWCLVFWISWSDSWLQKLGKVERRYTFTTMPTDPTMSYSGLFRYRQSRETNCIRSHKGLWGCIYCWYRSKHICIIWLSPGHIIVGKKRRHVSRDLQNNLLKQGHHTTDILHRRFIQDSYVCSGQMTRTTPPAGRRFSDEAWVNFRFD